MKDRGHRKTPVVPSRDEWGRFVSYKKHQREQREEQPSGGDRAAISTARATWWIAGLTIVIAAANALTLYEIWSGGNDTHLLAISSYYQALSSKGIAVNTEQQEQDLRKLAGSTKVVAQQALVQANTAKATFETEARPYVTIQPIKVYVDDKKHVISVAATEVNSGKIRAENNYFHCDVKVGEDFQKPATTPAHGPRVLGVGIAASSDWKFIEPQASEILVGTKRLTFFCRSHYEWRNEHEDSCWKQGYNTMTYSFFDEAQNALLAIRFLSSNDDCAVIAGNGRSGAGLRCGGAEADQVDDTALRFAIILTCV